MRLLIADDNNAFRTRLASILEDIKGIVVVGQAGDVPGTIEAIERTKPDTVILDIHMPGGNGLEVAQAVKAARRPPTVIMLDSRPEERV